MDKWICKDCFIYYVGEYECYTNTNIALLECEICGQRMGVHHVTDLIDALVVTIRSLKEQQ